MKSRSYPFEQLPYSNLFLSYIKQSDSLKSFYQACPFKDAEIVSHADKIRFHGNRENSIDALKRFNSSFDAPAATFKQIEKLQQDDSLAVVTGQQLSIYGGPLFTVYKTVTTIIYARRWEKLLGRPVIPVFWLADEDHDYEEVGEAGLLNGEQWRKLELKNGKNNQPVSRQTLGSQFKSFEKEFFDLLPETDFTRQIRQQLSGFYKEKATFRDAFARWFLYLFGKYGLVLAGSDDSEIKKLTVEPMLAAVEKNESLYRNLEDQSSRLEEQGFNRQAMVQKSNIFYLDPRHGRQKLEFEGEKWRSENGRAWSTGELIDEMRNNPGKFSPNVFLRPLMQDLLVPTLACVTGPGELAYYGQMKTVYEWIGHLMPMLVPRFSITLIEPAIERVIKEIPIEIHEYPMRIEDLEALYLKRADSFDVEGIFSSWSAQTEHITDQKKREIRQIDPTLVASADKAGTLFNNELNKLKGKTYKVIKKREQIQINRIHRIKENLFPAGKLQERQIAFIYYMNKYGLDMWDRLLDTLEEEIPVTHKMVYL